MLAKIFLILLIAGALLLFVGIKEYVVEGSATKDPQTVTAAEFEKKAPDNRHILLTGAIADLPNTIKLTTTRKRSGSTTITYFVPLFNPANVAPGKKQGVAIVKMGASDFEAQRAKGLDFTKVQGMRVTDIDFNSKAKEALVKEYGKEAVDRMPIIAWNQKPAGAGLALGLIAAGVLCLGGGVFSFLKGREQDAAPAPAS